MKKIKFERHRVPPELKQLVLDYHAWNRDTKVRVVALHVCKYRGKGYRETEYAVETRFTDQWGARLCVLIAVDPALGTNGKPELSEIRGTVSADPEHSLMWWIDRCFEYRRERDLDRIEANEPQDEASGIEEWLRERNNQLGCLAEQYDEDDEWN